MLNSPTHILHTRAVVALEWLAFCLGVILLGITVCDVFGRYLLARPIFGATEMIQWIMGAFIFCGLGLVSARDSHVVVDLISPQLARRYPRLMASIVGLFTTAGLAVITVQMARMGLDAHLRGKQSLVLELAIAVPLLFYTALSALATLLHIAGTTR